MIKRKSGFTLMEIMVVIIVIAVLASVAGPMIGSITDQGRSSATKSKLSNLKSALLAYQADVGRLPVTGAVGSLSSYVQDSVLSHTNEEKNFLATNSNPGWAQTSQKTKDNYQRKWKGPYMDSDPSDFMVDSWGNTIQYVAVGKEVYLQSAGADGDYVATDSIKDAFKKMGCEDSSYDDIIIQVTKLRKNLN